MDLQEFDVCKEGWLQKRGEHIKTWRPRYFILKNDGSFIGYNSRPMNEEASAPNNSFFLKGEVSICKPIRSGDGLVKSDCKIIKTEKPKNNGFIIRCLGSNRANTVERVFAATTEQEREEWIACIQRVSESLNGHFVVDTSGKFKNKITLHDFEFLKVLGKGTFGKVILCRERDTKRICAMKILKKSLIIAKNEIQHTQTENKVMRSIKHPFITSLIYSFQTSDLLCLVMEYVNGGELFFHLSREKRFTEDRSRFYCAEICLAIGYLHESEILYRDIKLENILLDNEGHIKLADFGLCKMNMSYNKTTDTFCGTPEYLAPEILTNTTDGGYGRAVDWWAVGVLLYEMLTGKLPFASTDVKTLFQKIAHEAIDVPAYLSPNTRSILIQLLEKNPEKRLGSSKNDFKELQAHLFFQAIDWIKLYGKQIEPPFKPHVSSEIDTRYFDKEFTGENVQITPPNEPSTIMTKASFLSSSKHFDSFSFYGSKTSLSSNNSNMQIIPSSDTGLYISNTSLDNLNGLPGFYNAIHNQDRHSDCDTEQTTATMMPYLVQYTDTHGHLYGSQTFLPQINNYSDAFLNSILYNTDSVDVNSFQLQFMRNFHYFDPALLIPHTNSFMMQQNQDRVSTTDMEIQ